MLFGIVVVKFCINIFDAREQTWTKGQEVCISDK